MENEENAALLPMSEKQPSLADVLATIEKACRDCQRLIPTTCISGCSTWKLKNQFKKLNEKTMNPDFMTDLLSTLKNKRRLRLLETISRKHCSTMQLQQELLKVGFDHSQRTIVEEYVNPLIAVGLADNYQNLYRATLFGQRISSLTKDFDDLEDMLSPDSECYEEIALGALMKEPRTYEKLGEIIPEKCMPRALSRLHKTALAETCPDKDYVFFFTTKRSPDKSELSPTEKRVREEIPAQGISARKLAKETGISPRRTYKYLRRLKGKKLVFTRKRPISYSITAKGAKVGTMLEEIHDLVTEASAATTNGLEKGPTDGHVAGGEPARKKRKGQAATLPTAELLSQR